MAPSSTIPLFNTPCHDKKYATKVSCLTVDVSPAQLCRDIRQAATMYKIYADQTLHGQAKATLFGASKTTISQGKPLVCYHHSHLGILSSWASHGIRHNLADYCTHSGQS